MNVVFIFAALCSLDVTASRQITVDRSIERTIVRVGAGLASSLGDDANLTKLCKVFEDSNASIEIRDARLLVNGQRDGSAVRRSASGLAKIGLFISHLARPGDSVELHYTLVYQGLQIRRQVTITQGQIVSRASFACSLGPQGRIKAVWLTGTAKESEHGTTFTTAATVRVHTGICSSRSTSRLMVVNRLAGRAARREIDSALCKAINDGQRLSADGHDAIVGHARRVMEHLMTTLK